MTKPRPVPNNLIWMIEDTAARVNKTIQIVRLAREKTQTLITLRYLSEILDEQYQILRDLEKARQGDKS